jgi:hypothetical protein
MMWCIAVGIDGVAVLPLLRHCLQEKSGTQK